MINKRWKITNKIVKLKDKIDKISLERLKK